MRYIVVTGGPLTDEAAKIIKELSDSAEDKVIIACDGGCDILAHHGIVPDIVVGDMDSISEDALKFIESNNIFTEKYPVEKDQTDSEIALEKTEGPDVFLITPFGGRTDHLLANIQLVLGLRQKGRKVTVTDGLTYCYPLYGEDSIEIDISRFDKPLSVSLIPWNFSEPVKGVTTEGLYYPLKDKDLTAGTTFSFSNHPTEKNGSISISIRAGLLLVTLTIVN